MYYPTISQLFALEQFNRILRENSRNVAENLYDDVDDDWPETIATKSPYDDDTHQPGGAEASWPATQLIGAADDNRDDDSRDAAWTANTNWDNMPWGTDPNSPERTRAGKRKNSSKKSKRARKVKNMNRGKAERGANESTPVALFIDPSLAMPEKNSPAIMSDDFAQTVPTFAKGKHLAKLVSKMLPPGEIGKFLGKGEFGHVWEFKPAAGKMMALKIPSSVHVDNINVYKVLATVYDRLPKNVAKHFVKVYGLWKIKRSIWFKNDFPIILIEKLEKTHESVRMPWKQIRKTVVGQSPGVTGADKDIEIVEAGWVAMQDDKKMAAVFKALFKPVNLSLRDAFTLAQHVRRLAPPEKNYKNYMQFGKLFRDAGRIGKQYNILPETGQIYADNMKDVGEMAMAVGAHFKRDFPEERYMNVDQSAINMLQSMTVKGSGIEPLVRALRYMYTKYKLIFRDVHSGNVMRRAEDDALVVSDLGMFKFR